MLQSLHIENIAIMDNVNIEFKKGFLALTGETGAGKSIIIDSVNLLTGERSSKEIVRSGAEKGVVEGVVFTESREVFDVLKENGIDYFEGDPIVLRREISSDGRSAVRINGRVLTTGVLREICSYLINIHGQNDNQAILNVSYHTKLLDDYASNQKELLDYMNTYKNHKEILSKIEELNKKQQDLTDRKEILKFKIAEIEKAKLKKGEFESLKEMRSLYLNTEKIVQGINNCYDALSGDENSKGANELVEKCLSGYSMLSMFDTSLKEDFERLNDLKYTLLDITENLEKFKNNFAENEIDINSVEERIDVISSLRKKYQAEEDEILDILEKMKEELDTLENSEFIKENLEKEEKEIYEELLKKADVLLKTRQKAKKSLEEEVNKQLKDLEMENAVFGVSLNEVPLYEKGNTKTEFLISANKGEPLKPLSKVASGGELSRVILALKVILSDSDKIESMVFDEVDAGVSGSAAEKIARKLKAVSKNKQVFVITHLPQVASFAENHYKVSKSVVGDKTVSEVTLLDQNERINEIARLLSGSKVTDLALKTAEEMLLNNNE